MGSERVQRSWIQGSKAWWCGVSGAPLSKIGCLHSSPAEEFDDLFRREQKGKGPQGKGRGRRRPPPLQLKAGSEGGYLDADELHGSRAFSIDPSHQSALIPCARTASYDVRNPHLVEHGLKETSKLEVDRLKGNVFINQYMIIKDVGRGAYGTVKLVYSTQDDLMYAMKVIRKKKVRRASYLSDPSAIALMFSRGGLGGTSPLSLGPNSPRSGNLASPVLDEYSNEIAVMKELVHPNVVKLYEVIHDPEQNKLLMIMEYVEGGCVMADAGSAIAKVPIPEATALRYFRDVVKGLEYLHFNRIVHGDLKPDNLLLTSSAKVKISDFGSARFCEQSGTIFATAGTPSFMAPEMCHGKPFNGFQGDLWALGVCLWMFVYGAPPFKGHTAYQVYEGITNAELLHPSDIPVSAELKDLLQQLLCKGPELRIELEALITHPWVTQNSELAPINSSTERELERVFVTLQHKKEAGNVSTPALVLAAPPDLKALIPDAEERVYQDGEHIIRQGERPEGLYYITEGTCELYHQPTERKLVADADFADALDDDGSSSEDDTSNGGLAMGSPNWECLDWDDPNASPRNLDAPLSFEPGGISPCLMHGHGGCDPYSNPLSPLSPHNPSNPLSPPSPHNPSNPLSPRGGSSSTVLGRMHGSGRVSLGGIARSPSADKQQLHNAGGMHGGLSHAPGPSNVRSGHSQPLMLLGNSLSAGGVLPPLTRMGSQQSLGTFIASNRHGGSCGGAAPMRALSQLSSSSYSGCAGPSGLGSMHSLGTTSGNNPGGLGALSFNAQGGLGSVHGRRRSIAIPPHPNTASSAGQTTSFYRNQSFSGLDDSYAKQQSAEAAALSVVSNTSSSQSQISAAQHMQMLGGGSNAPTRTSSAGMNMSRLGNGPGTGDKGLCLVLPQHALVERLRLQAPSPTGGSAGSSFASSMSMSAISATSTVPGSNNPTGGPVSGPTSPVISPTSPRLCTSPQYCHSPSMPSPHANGADADGGKGSNCSSPGGRAYHSSSPAMGGATSPHSPGSETSPALLKAASNTSSTFKVMRQMSMNFGANLAESKASGFSQCGTPTAAEHAGLQLSYDMLGRASAPDLALLTTSGSFVQRSGSYGTGKMRRAVARSPSMHYRMKQMLLKAKQRAVAQQRRGSFMLLASRGPGSVVGELALDGKAVPSGTAVVARGIVKCLLIRADKIKAYRNQPLVMAAINKTRNASLVQEAMERFVECEPEVAAAERIRYSYSASVARSHMPGSSSYNTDRPSNMSFTESGAMHGAIWEGSDSQQCFRVSSSGGGALMSPSMLGGANYRCSSAGAAGVLAACCESGIGPRTGMAPVIGGPGNTGGRPPLSPRAAEPEREEFSRSASRSFNERERARGLERGLSSPSLPTPQAATGSASNGLVASGLLCSTSSNRLGMGRHISGKLRRGPSQLSQSSNCRLEEAMSLGSAVAVEGEEQDVVPESVE